MMCSDVDMCQEGGSDEDIFDKTLSASFNDETEPLMPILDVSIFSIDNGNEKEEDSREKELKLRLSEASKRLQDFDECIDVNWSIDSSKGKGNLKETEEKLSMIVDDEIKSIVASAIDYIDKLEDQLGDLDAADEQVTKSTNRVMREIDDVYQEILNKICRAINKRRNLMRLEAEVYKCESLGPLKACRQQVNAQIKTTRDLIYELNHRHTIDEPKKGSSECQIFEAISHLGRIPAVPQQDELPYVAFSPPSKALIDGTIRKISEAGNVLRTGPVKIVTIEGRPGSLFVKWEMADPEYAGEEQNFVLQKASGQIHDVNSKNFQTIYEGSENSCFVRDLQVNEIVTLRARLRTMETAWSPHKIAMTKILPYEWSVDNRNYLITNNGTVAAKISNRESTLYSKIAQIEANHTIEFKFLEISQEGRDNEGIGLTCAPKTDENDLKAEGSLLITPLGKIFMDGEEKLMRLPKIRQGSRIIFCLERKDANSLRVNIESGEKSVIYDWSVQTPLYFAARFLTDKRWNFIVR